MAIEELVTKFNAAITFVPRKILPNHNAVTIKTDVGYSILIREDLSAEKIEETAEHEVWHIILGHLDQYRDLTEDQKELEVRLNMGGLND